MARVVVDPISRIEGHLKIETEVNGGKVTDAWATGTLFRGFELILKGRDPRDAFHITQRICGVCPTSHGHTSSMSIEDTCDVKLTENARLARNLVEGSQFVHSHILWFYHLTAVDFVDVVNALKAKPKDKGLKAVQDKLKSLADSNQLGPFANGYWGHPAYKLPPEVNLLAVSHYIEALDMQAEASNISAILGGIMPMTKSTPPGGFTAQPSLESLIHLKNKIQTIKAWVENVYLTDVLAIAPFYLDAAKLGKGPGNYLAWGVFDDKSFDPKDRLLPRGAILDSDLTKVIDPDTNKITEFIDHSWYDGQAKNPADGITEPNFTKYDTNGKYSWSKAPRLDGKPMEVGALSRVLVAYISGRKEVKDLVDTALKELGVAGKPEVLLSVLGRIAARVIETKVIIDKMEEWATEMFDNFSNGKNETFTKFDIKDGKGVGLWEAPRGALAHWNNISGGKLKNYQCVVPTTWNISPRDDKDVRGPIEEALVGTPVADPKKPLEILRVVHSFDPCLACAVHVIDAEKEEIYKFKVG